MAGTLSQDYYTCHAIDHYHITLLYCTDIYLVPAGWIQGSPLLPHGGRGVVFQWAWPNRPVMSIPQSRGSVLAKGIEGVWLEELTGAVSSPLMMSCSRSPGSCSCSPPPTQV